jgi:hypothetical protein
MTAYNKRLLEKLDLARALLHIHLVLSDAEDEKVKKRLDKEYRRTFGKNAKVLERYLIVGKRQVNRRFIPYPNQHSFPKEPHG